MDAARDRSERHELPRRWDSTAALIDHLVRHGFSYGGAPRRTEPRTRANHEVVELDTR